MMIIGVTGQICSGKSTVAKILGKLRRAEIIDADKIGHSVLLDKKVKARLVGYFGNGIIKNGAIDRKALAELAFAGAKNHKMLCKITYPALVSKIKNKLKNIKLRNPEATVIIDAAVLTEMGVDKLVDKLIAVKINKKEQLIRASEKWRISDKDIKKRIKLQLPWDRLASNADFIIDNSRSLKDTESQIKVWEITNGK